MTKASPEETPQKEYPGKERLEIAELKERLKKIEEQLENKEVPEELKEKEIKEEIKRYLKKLQEMPDIASPVSDRDEAKEINKLEPSQQVGALVSLVFEKGLAHAISVVRTLGNPAIIDEFHDTVVDRYYETLVKEGVLKP